MHGQQNVKSYYVFNYELHSNFEMHEENCAAVFRNSVIRKKIAFYYVLHPFPVVSILNFA